MEEELCSDESLLLHWHHFLSRWKIGNIIVGVGQGGWDKVRAHVVQLTFHRYGAQ